MLSLIKQTLSSGSKVNIQTPEVEEAVEAIEKLQLSAESEQDVIEWQQTVFDLIRAIKDPEKPETLEELDVVQEHLVSVSKRRESYDVRVEFVPTVPHCSLATLIGLCLRTKLDRELPPGQFKIDLAIKAGTHSTADEITKQINDKERVAAALENPNLRQTVDDCIADE